MEKILATQEEMYAVYEAPHKFYKLQVFLNCITEEQLEELNNEIIEMLIKFVTSNNAIALTAYEKNKGGQ